MWGAAKLPPTASAAGPIRVVTAGVIALSAVAFSIAGVAAFRRASTTVNPMRPEATSALVTTGVYALTRNPMYVGMGLVLLAWAFWLGSPWALFGPIAFVPYISRFQIVPEERVLAARFGEDFHRYCARVRRWL
jgi:protein-S-isoprenylcysteine O-methyltransferase Ste14